MSIPCAPASLYQLLELARLLSQDGATHGQFVHEAAGPCLHTGDQRARVQEFIAQMPPRELVELQRRMRPIRHSRLTLWSERKPCELCRLLHSLAVEQVD